MDGEVCEACGGVGVTDGVPCGYCDGTGWISSDLLDRPLKCEWCDGDFVVIGGVPGRKRFCSKRCRSTSYYYERKARESERR